MHVLLLGPYPPPEGGISRNLLAIREDLLRRGHKCSVVIIAKSTNSQPDPDVYYPRNALDLVRLLLALKYDILHLHVGGNITSRVLALIAICGSRPKSKKVFTLHSGGYAIERIKTAGRSSLTGLVFRMYDKIICVNSLMEEMFVKFGISKKRLHVIPPFVLQRPDEAVTIPEELKSFAATHDPFLLTVGLLEDTYNLPGQIEAMGNVLKTFPNAGLMIVGSGSLESSLQKVISTTPYSHAICLAGDVEHKITLHLINSCDILLRTTGYDGDAISIREALYLGTPVIATDNGMRPDGVSLIPIPLNTELLTEKITETIEGGMKREPTEIPEDRQHIGAVLEIYNELIRG